PTPGAAEKGVGEVGHHVDDAAGPAHVRPDAVAHLQPGIAVMIEAAALFRVAEDVVGFVDLFEFLGCLGVASVAVGVILKCQFAIGLVYVVVAGFLGHTENFVWIALASHSSVSGNSANPGRQAGGGSSTHPRPNGRGSPPRHYTNHRTAPDTLFLS